MKRYKSNYLFTISFSLCNIFLSLIPGLAIMLIALNPDEPEGPVYLLLLFAIMIMGFLVFGNALHFLICLFTNYTVAIDKDTISVKEKNKLPQSMKLEDIRYVVFDEGTVTKYGGGTPAAIILYNEGCKESVEISNPSFLMICQLQKRLRNASYEFRNYKRYIISCCVFAAGIILMILFM